MRKPNIVSIFNRTRSLLLASSFMIILIAMLPGCENKPAIKEREAEEFLKGYFDKIQKQEFEEVLDMYSPLFYKETPKETWLNNLKEIHNKLGYLKAYKVEYWKVMSARNIGKLPSGIYVNFSYDTTYSKFSAKENIIVFQARGSTTMKIIGHHVKSAGLDKIADA